MKMPTLYGVALAALLTACASAPAPPTQALQAAETAIADADRTRVADNASPELTDARTQLTAARDAVHNEDMILAQQLAEQSRANAELATAKAEAFKAKAVNDDMRKSIDTLKQEMRRTSGAAQ
ncbi:MAG TPA: DUF4398 domain-containing protein [Steroidobacteraceae bacterium]|nr:DUF4398 domain-containing protein [Steroidobacteraceae bacterium]